MVRRQCRDGRHFRLRRRAVPRGQTKSAASEGDFPVRSARRLGTLGGFREEYPGGVLHLFRYLLMHFAAMHQDKGKPGALPPEREALWREAMQNPDYRMYPHVFNVLTQKGQHMPPYFDLLIDPYDKERWSRRRRSDRTDQGADLYRLRLVRLHIQDASQRRAELFRATSAPKKLMFAGPAHLERPFHSLHGEILRWYDHWLKNIDTGIMDEPAVRYWVMGANEWRSGSDWPLPETQWTKFYLNSWERLQTAPFTPSSAEDELPPDAFVQMPPTQTNAVPRLRYMTDPLPNDVLIAGPSVLNLFAAIDQDDTNWFVTLKDIGPDVSVRSVREGEREIPHNLPERELTRGWLKASHRALDPKRSKPWRPWHPLTREAQRKVTPGEIRIRDRDPGDRQPVPPRPSHLRGDHERRHADRRRRRDQCRIRAQPHRLQPHDAAQDLSRCPAAIASAAADHPAITLIWSSHE